MFSARSISSWLGYRTPVTRSSSASMYSSRSCSPFMVRPFSHRSDQSPQRPEVEIQVLVLDFEGLLQLRHPLLQQHEGLAQALDLVRGQRAAVDPAQRLALHQLTQQLDQSEDQLRQPFLETLAVGVDPPAQRPVEAIELIAEQRELGLAGEQLVPTRSLLLAAAAHSRSSETKL